MRRAILAALEAALKAMRASPQQRRYSIKGCENYYFPEGA
jgi:hypothetical protein